MSYLLNLSVNAKCNNNVKMAQSSMYLAARGQSGSKKEGGQVMRFAF